MLYYEIWGGTVFESDPVRKKTDLDELVKECNRRRHVIEDQDARITELEAAIEQMGDSPLTWEGQNKIACEKAQELREAKKRIAELERNSDYHQLKSTQALVDQLRERITELEAAPVVVDVVKLDYDWKASGIPSDQDAFRYALEAQGVKCK